MTNNLYNKDMADSVDHPEHYNGGARTKCPDGTALYEPIKLIEVFGLDFSLGNALKYLIRAPHKGTERTDLEKARWYLMRHLENPGLTDYGPGMSDVHWFGLKDIEKVPGDWGISPMGHLGQTIILILRRDPTSAIWHLRAHIESTEP